jgi:maleylacetate reductase
VVLPYAMAYTAPAAPAAMARIAEAMRVRDAAAGVHDLMSTFGGPTSLAELGFDRADIDRVAELATAKPYPNLRGVTRDGVAALLEDAYVDQRPGGGTRFPRIELDQLTRTILASCDATPDVRLHELMTGTVMTLKRRHGSAVGGAPAACPNVSGSHVAPHNFHRADSLEPRHDFVADADVADPALRLLRNENQQ